MRTFIVTVLIIAMLSLGFCGNKAYTFPNKNQPVEEIELLYNPHINDGNIGGSMETICILDDESEADFLNELYQIETGMRTTPGTEYGFYVAQVTYQNGDIERFGTFHIEFIANGESPKRIGSYTLSYSAFEKLFCKYAGITSFEEDMAEREKNTATTAPSQQEDS